MDDITELLKPSWGAEQWILEGWNQTTAEEKEVIKNRLEEMFKDGLPFELKHDKLPYIHTFSLLAQLEVLAIQIPLKFQSILTNSEHKQLMRQQLLDEIFHGLVFTKIVYQLSAPHALPPTYSENIEVLCNFIRHEDNPQIAVVLLNLISEGWIEELFDCFKQHKIAPKVFETIINDEHRHVCEADLYCGIGLPDSDVIRQKVEYIENQLASNILLQYKYAVSVSTLLGYQGLIAFFQNLDNKHHSQLNKINLKPSRNWLYFMKFVTRFFNGVLDYSKTINEIELSPLRKTLMSQWKNPSDPTMVGQFNVNISRLDYFSGQSPHETLVLLMLQTISLTLFENESYRVFLDGRKLYTTEESFVGLIVRLPSCGDHLATIVLRNCHELTLQDLSAKIKKIRKRMVFCYKKSMHLEKEYPHLVSLGDESLQEMADVFYGCQFPGSPVVSLSDLSSFGFSQAKSPLRPNEPMKFTMLEVERQPVWNHKIQAFEPQDILAMSVSADHRVIDGNIEVKKIISENFEHIFTKMQNEASLSLKKNWLDQDKFFIKIMESLLDNNLDLGYKFLSLLQTMWFDSSFSPESYIMSGLQNKISQQPAIVF